MAIELFQPAGSAEKFGSLCCDVSEEQVLGLAGKAKACDCLQAPAADIKAVSTSELIVKIRTIAHESNLRRAFRVLRRRSPHAAH